MKRTPPIKVSALVTPLAENPVLKPEPATTPRRPERSASACVTHCRVSPVSDGRCEGSRQSSTAWSAAARDDPAARRGGDAVRDDATRAHAYGFVGDERFDLPELQPQQVRGAEGRRAELHHAVDDPLDAAFEESAVLHGDGVPEAGQGEEQ